MSLTDAKRAVESIDGVEKATIERGRTGNLKVEVRSNKDILDDLSELSGDGPIDSFEPVGQFMGSFEYEIHQ